jgi:hypothetical protein
VNKTDGNISVEIQHNGIISVRLFCIPGPSSWKKRCSPQRRFQNAGISKVSTFVTQALRNRDSDSGYAKRTATEKNARKTYKILSAAALQFWEEEQTRAAAERIC